MFLPKLSKVNIKCKEAARQYDSEDGEDGSR